MSPLFFMIKDADLEWKIQISTTQDGDRNDGVFPFRIEIVLDEVCWTKREPFVLKKIVGVSTIQLHRKNRMIQSSSKMTIQRY